MNLNNKHFLRGILFILAGILFMMWSFDIIKINIFVLFNVLIGGALIFYGESYSKFSETKSFGRVMTISGIVLVAHSLLVHIFGIPVKLIIAAALLVLGFYFVFVKSKVFLSEKGIFKDSRDDVYIKESFSSIHINNFSNDISGVKVRAFFSDLALNFIGTRMVSKDSIDFKVSAIFSNVRISINSNWNVTLNGRYIRNISTAYKTVNIKSQSLFCNIEVF